MEKIMSVDQAFNYKKVSDSVSTAGVISEEQLEQLGDEGYEALINLLPPNNEYAIQNEASIASEQGIVYECIPVEFSSPQNSEYQRFAEKMQALSDKKTMVHCAANYRVSAFYSIYAFRNLGWTEPQVYEWIASIWTLSEHPVWEQFVAEMLTGKDS
jgi:protein tyrosine phosphatase (PTP) superfamily phosphohydrolase (DUF442 family)